MPLLISRMQHGLIGVTHRICQGITWL
jgi:hypothetical protein